MTSAHRNVQGASNEHSNKINVYKRETAKPHRIISVCFKRHFEFNSHKVACKAEKDVGDSDVNLAFTHFNIASVITTQWLSFANRLD